MKFFNSVRFPVKGFGGLSLTSLSPVLIEVDSVAIVLRGYRCWFGFGFGSVQVSLVYSLSKSSFYTCRVSASYIVGFVRFKVSEFRWFRVRLAERRSRRRIKIVYSFVTTSDSYRQSGLYSRSVLG